MASTLRELIKAVRAFCLFALVFFAPHWAQAASLYFSPASGLASPGGLIYATAMVDSEGVAINNAESNIIFPKDLLSVVSVSKNNSIFSLWVSEPSFSNDAGVISFNGGIPNPGYAGASGKIATITFKAKAAGTASVYFTAAGVRANDGLGTDVLRVSSPLAITITGGSAPITPSASVSATPSVPVITSATHPDSEKWYSLKSATFSWPVKSGILANRLLLGRYEDTTPSVLYDPAISEKTIDDLDDGVWYLHVQLKNKAGWGAVGHYKFRVDKTPPQEFTIQASSNGNASDLNGRTAINFEAKDVLSGVALYRVKVGDADFVDVLPANQGPTAYILPGEDSGLKKVIVQAIDMAGNVTTAETEVSLKSIIVPEITEYPAALNANETLILRGFAEPKAKISVLIVDDTGVENKRIVRADAQGSFVLRVQDGFPIGQYEIIARSVSESGSIISSSDPITVVVDTSAFVKFGVRLMTYLSVIIPIVALIITLLILIMHGHRRITKMRRKVPVEVAKVQHALGKELAALKAEIQEHLIVLEKAKSTRSFTREEDQAIRRMKQHLVRIDKALGDEQESARDEF